jgi:hypothetical protein
MIGDDRRGYKKMIGAYLPQPTMAVYTKLMKTNPYKYYNSFKLG